MPLSITRIASTFSLFIAIAARAQTSAGSDYVIRNFKFENGETLGELRIHYLALGKPQRDAQGVVRNAVIVLHGTTGAGTGFMSRTFGGELFGPGQLLDTAKYYVVLPDGIGHGKSSKPSDGMHARFPKYTYTDMVEAQHELLTKGLNVNHLRLVMGTSMGCMHAWVWGERFPTFADGLVPLACAPTQIVGRNRMRSLEKITAPMLAINSMDDFVNPPELGVVEQLMPRVKRGKFILLPITDQTHGHGTHSLPAIWKGYLAEFLKGLPQR